MFELFREEPTFEVLHDADPNDVLLAGFSAYGLAGLTAVDYLVDHLELEEIGYIRAAGLPSITPFENGRPRHPTRLYSRSDLDITVLVGELFVPNPVSEAFAAEILEWTAANDVSEIGVLAGIPIPHGPDDHRTYYVATDDYRERRLAGAEIPPMGSGFVDGSNAALLEQGMESPLGVGLYVTPVHALVPDVEATLRLVDTVSTIYGLDVDSGPLKAFAEEVQQHYADLSERIEARERERELPDDRMYM